MQLKVLILFSGIIAKKAHYVGAKPLTIAASLAIMTYNDGHDSLLRLLPMIGLRSYAIYS